MSIKKPIKKVKQNGTNPNKTGVPQSNDKIALSLDNAPIFAAKFLESLLFETRLLRQDIQKLTEKING